MEPTVFAELQAIKQLLSVLVGTSSQPEETRFSTEALDQAAVAFKTMQIARGEWVEERSIDHYIKSATWNSGKFIREVFAFTAVTKRGHKTLYSKKELTLLAEELTARNIHLGRYQEFLADKAAFDKRVAKEATSGKNALPAKKNKGGRAYQLPSGLKNIATTPIPPPDPDTVRQDLARLKQEFKDAKLDAYVDVYKGTYAMLRHIYSFQKYLEPGLKRRCMKWCEEFNYANHALELITGKKEKFVVQNPSAIEL